MRTVCQGLQKDTHAGLEGQMQSFMQATRPVLTWLAGVAHMGLNGAIKALALLHDLAVDEARQLLLLITQVSRQHLL